MTETNECTHGYALHERRHCVHCMYADEIAERDAEIKRLREVLMFVYQSARNDINRWEGGVCVGTQRFSDRVFTRRLVDEIEPMLFTKEGDVRAEETEN